MLCNIPNSLQAADTKSLWKQDKWILTSLLCEKEYNVNIMRLFGQYTAYHLSFLSPLREETKLNQTCVSTKNLSATAKFEKEIVSVEMEWVSEKEKC